MTNKEKLIAKYKDLINPVQKNNSELLKWLKLLVDIECIDFSIFNKPEIDMFYTNLYYSTLNIAPKSKEFNLPIEKPKIQGLQFELSNNELGAKYNQNEFLFSYYKIIKNNKSSVYYQNSYNKSQHDFIYVIFEEKTGFCYSNSTKLHLELKIARGISKFDYDNNTIALIDLLSSIEFLRNEDY